MSQLEQLVACKADAIASLYNIRSVVHSFLYKNVVFQAQAEYSYFSADFGLKIFLFYSSIIAFDISVYFMSFSAEYCIHMYYMYRSSKCH